jgi:cobalt-zinc-cadmium resistance protein CzcA
VGEFGNLQDAIARLKVVIPVTLVLIAVLLLLNFGSGVDTLLAMSVIPMAVIGGVLALAVTGIPFSVSAVIGFVALFGVSVMEGIIILSLTIGSSTPGSNAGWLRSARATCGCARC